MFIAEGLPPILWALVWWRLVDDEPHQASWISDEAQAIEAHLAAEQQALSPVKNYAAAFRTPAVLLLAAQYLFWSIGISAGCRPCPIWPPCC